MIFKKICLLVFITTLSACYTTTIRPEGKMKSVKTPSFERSYDFFIFGLVGENSVDTSQACQKGTVEQMQAQSTFVDSLLGIITLGIYTPRTAKVWCK